MIKQIKTIIFAPKVLAIFICIVFSVFGIAINLNRFWQYESGYYDFGLFDRALWNVAHFKPPITDHFVFSGKIIFADHFNPSIFLLTPIYWITAKSEALFIIQDIFVGISGYVLYIIGEKVLKNKMLSLAVLITYFLFVGLQNAIFSDFHELTVGTLFIMLTYWAIITGNKKLFFLFFIITLGFKESLFLFGIGISFFIFFWKKEWKKIAIATFFISLAWGFLAIKVIIPYFSNGLYNSTPLLTGGLVGIFTRLFTPFVKIKTVFLTFFSFLFLPLLMPSIWPIILLNFIHRFLLEGSTRWDLGLHYNAELAPTLAVSTVLAVSTLQKKVSKKVVFITAILLVSTSLVLYRFILHGPYGLAYNPVFYNHTKDFVYLDKIIARIPQNSSVIAQNNIASRFLHNKDVWILRENYSQFKADYIMFDLRPGQNPTNFLGAKDIQKVFNTVTQDNQYHLIYHTGDQYIFKRRV